VIVKMVEMLPFRLGMLNVSLLSIFGRTIYVLYALLNNLFTTFIVFIGVYVRLFHVHDTSINSSTFWMIVIVICDILFIKFF